MPNVMKALRAEMRKVARDETKRAAKAARAELHEIRKSLTALQRRLARARGLVGGAGFVSGAAGRSNHDGRRARFDPALVRKHRTKLGLSRKAYAKLMGVSSLSIYFWETGRTRPRRDTILAWQDLRKKGARALRALAGVTAGPARPRRARKAAAAPARTRRTRKAAPARSAARRAAPAKRRARRRRRTKRG